MNKDSHPAVDLMSEENTRRFVEKLRARLNVLNASVFLLESKITTVDPSATGYLNRVNEQLELLRTLLIEETEYKKEIEKA